MGTNVWPETLRERGQLAHTNRKVNIKTYLEETGYENVDWIQLAQDKAK
jgi:hypothetical protein